MQSISCKSQSPMANLLFNLLCLAVTLAAAQQPGNITSGSKLYPNGQPWLSPSGRFAFGFYQQGDGFRVGTWLLGSRKTVVWTANRDAPPVDPDSNLEFTTGKLILWTKQSRQVIADPPEPASSASLLDSGDLVIYSGDREVWRSFDYPTDTVLVGQRLELGRELVSSVSWLDSSSGRFVLSMQRDGNLVAYPANNLWRSENSYWAKAIQTRGEFGEVKEAFVSVDQTGQVYMNVSNDVHFQVKNIGNSSENRGNRGTIYRATLDPDGILRLYSHSSGDSMAKIEWSALENQCKCRGFCGANSYCSPGKGYEGDCSCFPGFEYLNPKEKNQGCYRGFVYDEICNKDGPDSSSYNVTPIKNLTIGGYPFSYVAVVESDCRKSCQEDCSCWAAQYSDGTCSKYKLPIIYSTMNENDKPVTAMIKQLSSAQGLSGLGGIDKTGEKKKNRARNRTILILSLALGFVAFLFSLVAISSFVFYRNREVQYRKLSERASLGLNEEFTLRLFSYSELDRATDGFKEELRSSSFGKVYKGTLPDHDKAVAVKRLETTGDEGENEFRAEITAIGQTHHGNIIQLLGFCIEGSRKLLVYEFMSRGTLADVVFNSTNRPFWKQRVKLARDIARGILYLHEECETPIIHSNIKPQNILVDDSWTAKISDFGLARPRTQPHWPNGYLAPELQTTTSVTEKVDVYSYGVVLLEIVCCRSHLEVNVTNADEILLSTWVQKCFVDNNLQKLVGDEDVDMKSLERMVKVGLLCIQDNPKIRPSMKNVVLMLEGTIDIPLCLPASIS